LNLFAIDLLPDVGNYTSTYATDENGDYVFMNENGYYDSIMA